jgi:hypothetical protein
MRSSHGTIALARLRITCYHGTLDTKVHVRESARPIFESFIAQSLARSNIDNLAMFWQLLRDAILSSTIGIESNGKELGHGHFEEAGLASAGWSTDHDAVVAVGEHTGYF